MIRLLKFLNNHNQLVDFDFSDPMQWEEIWKKTVVGRP